ncbi:Elongation Factor 3-like protein [Rozella allomycis CSF55]|uniref:Elongation Factor 3-like protein n=1 Tax=Rozella allomycis (strain CSF55) TaxID=988480 RepID=A0A075ASK3_ROZAC|nr:Elongation Factor 3-like protein [Rozella allomycis CSF55]|eukprot:EPZ31523.1 Elongation Factor 3-like protein [Rozella allomycis CSF55]
MEELLQKLYICETSEECYETAENIALEYQKSYDVAILENLAKNAKHKSGFNRESAMIGFEMLLKKLHGDKGEPVRAAARNAINELVELVPPTAMECYLFPILYEIMENGKWQAKVAAVKLLAEISKSEPELVANCLADIIEPISHCMHEIKSEVSEAAKESMRAIGGVVGNPDIQPLMDDLIHTMAVPSELENSVHLSIRSSVTTRRTVIIIRNLMEMVRSANDVEVFAPMLLPWLERMIETASFPEIRNLSQMAKDILEKKRVGAIKMDDEEIEGLVRREIPEAEFVVPMLVKLVKQRQFNNKKWQRVLSFEGLEKRLWVIEFFKKRDKELYTEEGVDDTEDDLCNCEFSLNEIKVEEGKKVWSVWKKWSWKDNFDESW